MQECNMPLLSAFADESSEDFDEQLEAVRRNGITHIELRQVDGIALHNQSLDAIREFKKRADDVGVGFSAAGSGLGKCGLDDDIGGQVRICRHLVDIAHILETPYIRMFSFRIPKERSPESCRQQVIDKMGSLVEAVAGSGVMLAHENEKHIYGETAERCLDLYQTFYGTGVFKGVFDFANFTQAGQVPLTDCWPLLKDYTEYFHIKDARLSDGRVVPPGQGDGGLKEILGEAIGNGFSSFLTLEPHLWPKHFGGTAESRFDLAATALKELLAGICRRMTVTALLFIVAIATPVFSETPDVEIAEAKRGLVVHVGTDPLPDAPGALVASVEAEEGLLPLVDNIVNLLVLGRELPEEEVLRVLAPGGVAVTGNERIVKPSRPGVDEWTHYLYGPGGNPVSEDRVVDMPKGLQWIAGPPWTRDHDAAPVLSCQVTSGGRLFYVFDEGPIGVIDPRVPTRLRVIARDAYSGVVLWEYDLPDWYPSHQQWGSVPVTLNQRLVAIDDTVYVTRGLHGPVIMLDAATGEEKGGFEGSEETGEILVTDGKVITGVRREAPRDSDAYPHLRSTPFKGARGVRGLLMGRGIQVFEAATGKRLWHRDTPYRASTIVSDGARLLFVSDLQLVCLDLSTGESSWTAEGIFSKLMLRDGIAVAIRQAKGRQVSIQAYAIETGKRLWQQNGQSLPTFAGCFYIPPEIFVKNGHVWVKSAKSNTILLLDLKTGEQGKSFSMAGGMTEGHHVRCYPAKATERYVLFNKRGIEFVDRDGTFTKHDWVRGQCRMGILPANGLIYVPPNGCNCGIETYVRGMQALHPRKAVPAVDDARRLLKGPAYDSVKATEETGWPTFRHDARRSASRDEDIELSLAPAWTRNFERSVTTATATESRLYVGEGDQVLAVELTGGEEVWRFPATIDSPPTLVGGRVVFGGRDGYVYCLRAADGELCWRFLAAPVDRRHVAFGRLESVWPCHGAVLVREGVVYVAAGRSSFLDGGIHLYGLGLGNGGIRYHTVLATTQPQQTTRMDTFNPRGALTDILVSDGEHLYMRQLRFDWQLKRLSPFHPFEGQTPGGTPRVMASSGFLDDSENKRIHRVAARSWAGRYTSAQTQQLSLHGDINYGCRIFYGLGWKSHRYHAGDGTHVFAHDLVKAPEAFETLHAGGHQRSIRYGGPFSYNRQKRETLEWETHIPIRAFATVVAGDKLLVAGRYDRSVEDTIARTRGNDTGALWVLDKTSGDVLKHVELPCVPQLDGMLVAGNRIVITGKKSLVVLGAR